MIHGELIIDCFAGGERTDEVCINVLDTRMDKKKMVKKEESA